MLLIVAINCLYNVRILSSGMYVAISFIIFLFIFLFLVSFNAENRFRAESYRRKLLFGFRDHVDRARLVEKINSYQIPEDMFTLEISLQMDRCGTRPLHYVASKSDLRHIKPLLAKHKVVSIWVEDMDGYYGGN